MYNNKTLERINDAIEEAIRPIIGKGAAMTAAELEVLTKAVCTIEKIKQIEDAEIFSEYPRNGYNSYGNYHAPIGYDNYSNGDVSHFYRDDNSYRRGRSQTTGRYISRDDGYSTRRYYDGFKNANGMNEHGYSGHSIKDRMVAQLERMYDEAQTEHERQTVNDWIRRLENAN